MNKYRIKKHYASVSCSGGVYEHSWYYMPQRLGKFLWWSWWIDLIGGDGFRNENSAREKIKEHQFEQIPKPTSYIEVE